MNMKIWCKAGVNNGPVHYCSVLIDISNVVLVKAARSRMLFVLSCALGANVSQAAQQHFQINAAKGRVILSAPASVGGPAPSSANRKSGMQFPVIPAGAMVGQTSASRPNRQNQLRNKTGTNNPTGIVSAPPQRAGVIVGTSSQSANSALQQAGTAGTSVQPSNPAPQ